MGAGGGGDLVRGPAQGWNMLPHCKNRDVLPPGQQPQALRRHLCLGKGNVIWDIQIKGLFGSPSPTDPVGFAATGSPLGMRRPASARGTTSAPHRLPAAALTGWRLGPWRRMGLCPAIPKGDFWV